MFETQVLQAAIIRGSGSVVERCIAFEQSYNGRGIIEGKQFAVAPHPTEVARVARRRTSLPKLAQSRRPARWGEVALDLERPAAARAHIDSLAKAINGAACRSDAALNGLFGDLLCRVCSLLHHLGTVA